MIQWTYRNAGLPASIDWKPAPAARRAAPRSTIRRAMPQAVAVGESASQILGGNRGNENMGPRQIASGRGHSFGAKRPVLRAPANRDRTCQLRRFASSAALKWSRRAVQTREHGYHVLPTRTCLLSDHAARCGQSD